MLPARLNRTSIFFSLVLLIGLRTAQAQTPMSVDEVLDSKLDIWGEAALHRPEGPTYEYFRDLLPPLRYVEAPFEVYPIVLGAPGSAAKARLVGNGSAINALARQPNWVKESGIPVAFRVGLERAGFGVDPSKLTGPNYADGYLPIVKTQYRHDDSVYEQECFADVDPVSAALGVVFVRFSLPEGKEGKVEAQFEGTTRFLMKNGVVTDSAKKVVACFDKKWEADKGRNVLGTFLKKGEVATLAIFTVPGDTPIDSTTYDAKRTQCTETWNKLLAEGANFEVPEPVVNNAWRSLLIGNYMLLTGDEIRYSHGNPYATLYISESGDAMRTFALYGHAVDSSRMMVPLLHYTRKNLEFHQAAFKLQMLTHYFRLTHDAAWVNQHRDLWEKEVAVIVDGREKTSGMLPREKYCGDIATMVYSLSSNANCWRGLRDTAVMLEDLGETDRARTLAATAAEYRKTILTELEKSTQRDVTPPFIPIAMSGEEKAYDDIVGSHLGGYWNLMIHYVLGSGVFRADSQTATDLINYVQQHGGLCMGLVKWRDNAKWFYQAAKVLDDLYGMRYALALQERDEPDRALVSFYGKLANGMTRDTFISCEGSDIKPRDAYGRYMYLPPNSTSNASFLQQLRGLLVQDLDLDDDGRPETLRLMFATPRQWLRDGAHVKVSKALTVFGDVGYTVESSLAKGVVTAEIDLPKTAPKSTLFRLRLPEGYKVISAKAGDQQLAVIEGQTIDLTGQKDHIRLVATVTK